MFKHKQVLKFKCSIGGHWLSNYCSEARIQEQLQERWLKTRTKDNFEWRGVLKHWWTSLGASILEARPDSGMSLRPATLQSTGLRPVCTRGKTGTNLLLQTKISTTHQNLTYIQTESGIDRKEISFLSAEPLIGERCVLFMLTEGWLQSRTAQTAVLQNES